MPNAHKLIQPPETTYGIACDPLNGIYHEFTLQKHLHRATGKWVTGQLATGLPVVVYGDTKDEVRTQLFTEWTEDEDGNLAAFVARETTLSVDYTMEDADQTVADAHAACEGLMIRSIKHPDRDEWALHVSSHILSNGKEGAAKDRLMAKHVEKVTGGKNKSKSDAKQDNWHKGK